MSDIFSTYRRSTFLFVKLGAGCAAWLLLYDSQLLPEGRNAFAILGCIVGVVGAYAGAVKRQTLLPILGGLFLGKSIVRKKAAENQKDTAGEARASEAAHPQDARKAQKEEGPTLASMLEQCDPVVPMLLFNQAVSPQHVSAAWHRREKDGGEASDPLWRIVARLPEVDRTAVFSHAAQIYGFDSVDFNMYSARALIRKKHRRFTHEEWKRMVELNVIPVEVEYRSGGGRRWVFAAHDPSFSAVKSLLDELDVATYTLGYAPESVIEEVFSDALPRLAERRAQAERRAKKGFLSMDIPSSSPSSERVLRHARRYLERSEKERATGSPIGGEAGEDLLAETPTEALKHAVDGMLRQGARAACLLTPKGERDTLAVYYLQGNRVRAEQPIARFSGEMMRDFATGQACWLPPTDDPERAIFEHWFGSGCLQFHLAVEPLDALPDALPDAQGSEVVVVERLSGQ